MKLPQPLQSPLSRRLFAWALCAVVATILVESSAQLYFSYTEDVGGIRQNIRETLRYHLPSLGHGLYRMDEEQVRMDLDALLQDPEIAYLAVRGSSDLRNFKVEVGNSRITHAIFQSYRLSHRLPAGQSLPVGSLQVAIDLSEARARLWHNALVNLLSNGLAVLAVSLTILFLMHIGVTRHLHVMARHAAAIDLSRLDRTLKLKRLFRRQRPDEIDQVVHALNDLQIRLQEDIQQRTQIERRLQQAQKLESLGTLAGGVAHDINNVLGIILGQTELALASLPPDAPARERLELSLQGVDRAKDIVRQILAFGRRAEVQRRPVDIARAVKDSLTLLRATFPKTIELKTDIAGDSGRVIADPTEIQQVLMNLCNNAAQAMEGTQGTIFVSLQALTVERDDGEAKVGAPEGAYALLTVRDTGGGMDKETLERVFEPYFTTKDIGKGTGLGLSVVHGIVTGLKGAITVHSALGMGATFRIFLPSATDEKEAEPSESAAGLVSGGKERVLLVDDEELLVQTTGDSLEKLGYRVMRFYDSQKALDFFRENPEAIDCLVTDLTMPKLNGVNLAAAVQALRPGLPVVLCTGFSERLDETKSKRMGLSAFVMKPVLRAEMARVLRRVLDQRSQAAMPV